MQNLPQSNPINVLSPLDGRYLHYSHNLRLLLSEKGLIVHRLEVEIAWILALSEAGIPELTPFSEASRIRLKNLLKFFSDKDAKHIKEIEIKTNHDVKAIEYWIKEKITGDTDLEKVAEFVHFACTSEDINSTAYALMLKRSRDQVLIPKLNRLTHKLQELSLTYASQPMLSRTHGQPASPTTLGKEFANVLSRLQRSIKTIEAVVPLAKLNGATGNYSAHVAAYPKIDWPSFSKSVLYSLELKQNQYTTQIEPHDWMAELFDSISRTNTILLDLNRDMWGYISLGYFKQKSGEKEVGSSTMPHKINPIDFENSEGNLGIANALLRHFSEKLPISRWQRDLTDSTVLRNLGPCLGYCVVAWDTCFRGLSKLEVDTRVIDNDINNHWEVLAEPIQTVMRCYGLDQPYERLKELTQGKKINKTLLHGFVRSLDIPEAPKNLLLDMEPSNYIGLAENLAKKKTTTYD